MESSEIAISARNLTKQFGNLLAVDDISFEISTGEIVGLLGPNGAGKTTTIRMLTGVFEPDGKSKIHIFNLDLRKNLKKCKTFFGVVPETSNVFSALTLWQNLTLAGKIYGLTSKMIKKRGSSLLKQFELENKKNSKARTLSKGLKQRLNLCLALLHDPPVLILDEPTSGLDPISTITMRNQIIQMKERGKTILITTHDMLEAQNLCDRVLIMNKGKIIADANPNMLRKNFKQKSVISFQTPQDLILEQKQILNRHFELKELKKKYYQFRSDDPLEDITKLHNLLKSLNITIVDFQVHDISLEEIFIDLITKTGIKDKKEV
ncbi:MAG: ABC transporter ATP-binding protein [Promethearchaeota archaeon]